MSTDRPHRLWRQAALQVTRHRPRRRWPPAVHGHCRRPRRDGALAIQEAAQSNDRVSHREAAGSRASSRIGSARGTMRPSGVRTGRSSASMSVRSSWSVATAPAIRSMRCSSATTARMACSCCVAARCGRWSGPTSTSLRGVRVLCYDDGKPLAEHNLTDLLPKVGRLANVRCNGSHIQRHTFCSHLAMRGAPARAIQELLGHRDLATTQKYMHLIPSAVADAIRLLDGTPRGDLVETAI
jgi:hypothetical protein